MKSPNRQPFNHRVNSGFTLVELLLYMGLLAIFLGILSQLFISILELHRESQATSAVELDSRFIVTRLMYDVNRANTIITPASLGGSSDQLEITIEGVNYRYYLDGGKLKLTNNLGSHNLNGSESTITAIAFTRIGNAGGRDTVRMQFTIESVVQRVSGSETRTLQTTVGTR